MHLVLSVFLCAIAHCVADDVLCEEPYPTDSGYWLDNKVESAAQLHDDWRETIEQRPE